MSEHEITPCSQSGVRMNEVYTAVLQICNSELNCEDVQNLSRLHTSWITQAHMDNLYIAYSRSVVLGHTSTKFTPGDISDCQAGLMVPRIPTMVRFSLWTTYARMNLFRPCPNSKDARQQDKIQPQDNAEILAVSCRSKDSWASTTHNSKHSLHSLTVATCCICNLCAQAHTAHQSRV